MATSIAGETTALRRRAGMMSMAWRMAATFAVLIGVGTILLSLPAARQEGREVAWVDSLFTAVSATCLTGLSTVNLGETYTRFGQGVVLALIQLGGLGITTAGALFLLFRLGGSSLVSEDFIGANVGRLREARPVDVFIYSCLVVLTAEALGFIGLTYVLIAQDATGSFEQTLWEAAFHSVSAFCNAGFSVYPEGLQRWRADPFALGIVCVLVITGGLGLLTIVNFRYYYPWRRDPRSRGRLTLQTRLCLWVTLVLLVLGTLLTWVNELDHTLKEVPWHRGLLWSFVHSTMTRTAGFNVVDNAGMAPETLLGSLVLMFIGGAPGSMAGGIKVTSLVLLGVVAWSALRRRSELLVGRHTVPGDQAANAVMVTLLSAFVLALGVGLLMNLEAQQPASETDKHWLAVIFEATSAFCTVGLSAGVTPLLTTPGKLVIIALMFVGRLGPLCLAMHLSQPAKSARVSYPREDLSVG